MPSTRESGAVRQGASPRVALSRRALALGAVATVTTACSSDSAPATTQPGPRTAGPPATGGRRPLIVYFSRPGENYHYGDRRDLEVGNTQVLAESIARMTGGDLHRVVETAPYPWDYERTVERNRREQEQDARPALRDPAPSLGRHDVVLLGSPVWNVRLPMVMRTLLEAVDVGDRRVMPFVTHAVSGLGQVVEEYRELLPQARLGEGLAVQGEEVRDADAQTREWLARAGLV